MRIAIVHHHLGAGGVREVIVALSAAMTRADWRHVVLTDDPVSDPPPALPLRRVPGLGYREPGNEPQPVILLEQLRRAAADALGGAPDVWHFHNHSLGKNPAYAALVPLLAQAGERLLLHIHDLAEDGRPENARALAGIDALYPISPRVHYGFLNRGDLRCFTDCGLPKNQASVLPNPVTPANPRHHGGPPLLLAPLRGIRRKNLGELLLLAALAPEGTRTALTRAPENERWTPRYEFWKRAAEDLAIPAALDAVGRLEPAPGAGTGFDAWREHASHFLTTSVSEGFGRVFLEAPAAGKPLIGRWLPHVDEGTDHSGLYRQLLLPADWFDHRSLRDQLGASMAETWRAWGRGPAIRDFDTAFDALGSAGFFDFGKLPEEAQLEALRRIVAEGRSDVPLAILHDGTTTPLADWLAAVVQDRRASEFRPPAGLLAACAGIYHKLTKLPAAAPAALDRSKILDHHLAPPRFHILKSADVGRRPRPDFRAFRAVVFDIYGTLLDAQAGGVKPDPAADPRIARAIASFGYEPPPSPSARLRQAVEAAHAASPEPFPEVDLRGLWRDILALPDGTDTSALVIAIETEWHPATWIDGAREMLERLADSGIPIGLLSNAQCNTLPAMGRHAELIDPELAILSYRHRIAKPSPALFRMLAERLAKRGIPASETLYVGNDPLQDMVPARAAGFASALFTGHPASHRPGYCFPDCEIAGWHDDRKRTADADSCEARRRHPA